MPKRIRTQQRKKSCFAKSAVNVVEPVLYIATKKVFDFKASGLAEQCDSRNQGGNAQLAFKGITEYGLVEHGFKKSPFKMPGSLVLETHHIDLQLPANFRLKYPQYIKLFLASFGPMSMGFLINRSFWSPPNNQENIVNGCCIYVPPAIPVYEPVKGSAMPPLHCFTCYGWKELEGITYFALRNTHGSKYGLNGDIYFQVDLIRGPKFLDFDFASAMWSENGDPKLTEKHNDYQAYNSFINEFLFERNA